MDAPPDSSIGGTFVGSPLGCVAGLAVLSEIDRGDLLARGTAIGERIRARFLELQGRHEAIGEVRGLGPMLAIELVRDRAGKEPAPELASAIVQEAAQRGLILLKSGVWSNCIRVLVSLVASDEQIEESLEILDEAVAAALVGRRELAGAAG